MSTYAIHTPRYTFLRDRPNEAYNREKLLFHVRTGDYFATLATILGLVIDALDTSAANEKPFPPTYYRDVLMSMHDDLVFLHKTHRIIPQQESDDIAGNNK
jgi:hypothetical protein